ncbi:MAG TPA: regulatory protein RecX [Pseudolysinimonas sp.]
MDRSDDWLAPVSYLPGVQPSSAEPLPAETVPAETVPAEAVPAETVPADRERDRAHNVSLNSLTKRGMSKREVERTLRSRQLDDDVIAAELDRLERAGLVDDLALAQNLVGSLQERKGLGRSGIAAELTRRLLSPAAIEYALELVDTGDELARAREIAVARARQLTSYDHETAVRRLSAYLARRGYGGSTVRAAVEHALPRRQQSAGVRFR